MQSLFHMHPLSPTVNAINICLSLMHHDSPRMEGIEFHCVFSDTAHLV